MKSVIRVLLPLVFTAFIQIAHAVDTAAPVLTSISVSPGSVDVAGADQTITVTLTVTDDESGLLFGNIFIYDFADNFIDAIYFNPAPPYLTSGTATNGTYSVDATVPQYAAGGTYEVRVLLRDNESQDRRYGGTNEAYPTPGDENFLVVNAGTVDTTAPDIAAVSVTPGTIDTSSVSQIVTVNLNITDDLTGFDYASVEVYDPVGTYRGDITGFITGPEAYSGDALDGLYDVPITIPAGSLEGTWTLEFFLRDRVANGVYLSGLTGADFVVSNGSGGPTGDLSDAVDATQYSFSTYGEADWFFQTATTYDGIDAAESGDISDFGTTTMEVSLEGPGTLTFWWKVDSEDGFDFLGVDLSGSLFDEISGVVDWTLVTIPIPSGPQTVTWSYSKDSSVSDGSDAGWVDRVYYATDSDVEDPVLQYINISPSPVDISSGDQTVTITVEVSDDNNGVYEGYISLWDPDEFDYDYLYFNSLDRISGDAYFGTYEVTTTFYQSDFIPTPYFALGTWRADVEVVEDGTFNTVYYSPYDNPFPNPGDEFFTVADGVGADAQAPLLVSIDSISPDPVDVSGGPQAVTVTFQVTDNFSGFDFGSIYLYGPGGGFVSTTGFGFAELISGDEFNGTYAVDVTIPLYAPAGSWNLNFFLQDFDGNGRDYPFDTTFPNPGDEIFSVLNTGTSDTEAPVLQSILLSPQAVDTTTIAQSIDVTITVSENLSGIRAAALYIYDPLNTFIGSLYTYFPGNSSTSQVFTTTLEIPQGSLEGTWRCALYVADNVGNTIYLGVNGDPFPTPGDAEFEVGPLTLSTYDAFTTLYSLTGNDALPGSNPDKDWLINILELLLGTDPTVVEAANPALMSSSLTGDQLVLAFVIDPALTIQTNGDFLEISEGGNSPFVVTGQTSSLLSSGWTNTLPTFVSDTTYFINLTIAPGSLGFIRLSADLP